MLSHFPPAHLSQHTMVLAGEPWGGCKCYALSTNCPKETNGGWGDTIAFNLKTFFLFSPKEGPRKLCCFGPIKTLIHPWFHMKTLVTLYRRIQKKLVKRNEEVGRGISESSVMWQVVVIIKIMLWQGKGHCAFFFLHNPLSRDNGCGLVAEPHTLHAEDSRLNPWLLWVSDSQVESDGKVCSLRPGKLLSLWTEKTILT